MYNAASEHWIPVENQNVPDRYPGIPGIVVASRHPGHIEHQGQSQQDT
jgi:hypothetical protein